MKKIILLLMTSLSILSCNSRTDLEILKPDQDVSNIIKSIGVFEKKGITDYGSVSYESEKLSNFKFGNVKLSDYNVKADAKNSLVEYSSSISVSVENNNTNKFTGLVLDIEKEDEGINLLNYIKNKLGNPLLKEYENKDNHLQAQYLWDNKKTNELVYIKQHTQYLDDSKNGFVSTQLTIIKKDLKFTPDMSDERNTQDNIKKLLDENPNAFDLFEIFKNRFSNN